MSCFELSMDEARCCKSSEASLRQVDSESFWALFGPKDSLSAAYRNNYGTIESEHAPLPIER